MRLTLLLTALSLVLVAGCQGCEETKSSADESGVAAKASNEPGTPTPQAQPTPPATKPLDNTVPLSERMKAPSKQEGMNGLPRDLATIKGPILPKTAGAPDAGK